MNPIKLSKDPIKCDINQCIICQKDRAKVKLSTSENFRATIRTCIEKRGDNSLYGLTEIERDEIE